MAEPAREPTISRAGEQPALAAMGSVFGMGEWMGSGPPQLHVHHEDDEAWHVLEGEVEFRFAAGRREVVGPATTVFVPAGVAHTYVTTDDARYLIVLTPRLSALIDALHESDAGQHAEVYRRLASELLE
jgi:mannose-6-phosphate isomerase-like protein (cupin superfamily)